MVEQMCPDIQPSILSVTLANTLNAAKMEDAAFTKSQEDAGQRELVPLYGSEHSARTQTASICGPFSSSLSSASHRRTDAKTHTELTDRPSSCNYSAASASNYILIELFTIAPSQTIPQVKVDWGNLKTSLAGFLPSLSS